jgi:hypothetical protein
MAAASPVNQLSHRDHKGVLPDPPLVTIAQQIGSMTRRRICSRETSG